MYTVPFATFGQIPLSNRASRHSSPRGVNSHRRRPKSRTSRKASTFSDKMYAN